MKAIVGSFFLSLIFNISMAQSKLNGGTPALEALKDSVTVSLLKPVDDDKVMEPSSITLGEVSVAALRPEISQDKEKLIFNVENSAISAGSTAMEILERIPGIFVDHSGDISINGQSGTQVKINGRVINMAAEDVAVLLRSLDAGMLKKIEVISNPDATQRAEGSAGIINIVLKKDLKLGFNGSVNMTHRQSGNLRREVIGGNGSYIDGALQLTGSYSYSDRTGYDSLQVHRVIPSVENRIDQTTSNRYPYRTHIYNVDLSYSLSKNAELQVAANGNVSQGATEGISTTKVYDMLSPDLPVSRMLTANTYEDKSRYHNFDASYKYSPDTLGSEFLVSASYSRYSQTNRQLSEITDLDYPTERFSRTGTVLNDISIKYADFHYFKYFRNLSVLKMGASVSGSGTDDDVHYWRTNNLGTETENDKTVNFRYRENILGLFSEYAGSFKKIEYIIGLRGEYTAVDEQISQLSSADSTIGYKRFDLFPFLYVDRTFLELHTVAFVASRRITRPNYQDLNPFLIYYDPYTYTQGNPGLRPQFTSKFELSYAYKHMPLLRLGYTLTSDAITTVTYQDSKTLTTYRSVGNLGEKKVWSVSLGCPIPFRNIILSSNYFTINAVSYDGYYEFAPVSISRTSFSFTNNTQIRIRKSWQVEVGGFYNRGFLAGLFAMGELSAVNIGVQKSLFHNKVTIKAAFTDIFRKQINHYDFRIQDIDIDAKVFSDTRAVSLSIVYKFGIDRSRKTQTTTGIESGRSRIIKSEH